MSMSKTNGIPRRCGEAGFSMIEVLIALLVLAVGLLGFAMLQSMSVRFAQSANYRTMATQLADTLLEQVRVDRENLSSYVTSYSASATASDCVPSVGTVSASTFKTVWQCQLGRSLGDSASATVTLSGTLMTVSVSWNDDRWNANSAGNQTFATSTRL
jgi:type IV pilus assembly protein PilV